MYVVYRAESSSKPSLLAWLSFVQLSSNSIQDNSREEFVDYRQQADRAIIANVAGIPFLVQQHGLAGLPLAWNLAFRQVPREESSQGVDESWR